MSRELKIERIELMKCIFCGHWFAHDSEKIFNRLSNISGICNSYDCIEKYKVVKEDKKN